MPQLARLLSVMVLLITTGTVITSAALAADATVTSPTKVEANTHRTLRAMQTTTPTSTPAPSCGPRVRRSWTSLSTTEKGLYLDAINASITNGYHALFTEVHSDMLSGNEAHRTCGMFYWHRRFLLAYENMLRSLAPRFACITIPYWDYFADYAKKLNGICSTLDNCSPILSDLGGYGSGPFTATLSINGILALGSCTSAAPLSNFCESSTLKSSSCAKCLPRANFASIAFPSGLGYASLARYLSLSYGFSWFSQNLHYGAHNTIHNSLSSVMATMATSADPIFYNHHSTIDLIQQLYYDCQVGRVMTETEKKTSPYAFQQCALSLTDVCPTVLSNMTQSWQALGGTRIAAEDHPQLSQFFAPLPKQYWYYVSATDMDDNSYSYESDTLVTLLNASGLSCPRNKIRRLEETQLPQQAQPERQLWDSLSQLMNSSDIRVRSVAKTFGLFQDLYSSSFQYISTNDQALEQVELMECAYYSQTFGSVDDFSATFKQNFGLSDTAQTTCSQRMKQLKSGLKRIFLTDWYNKFKYHLTDRTTTTATATTTTTTSTSESSAPATAEPSFL